jgi:N-acetylmuramoyl-L-alanine amidase
MRKKIYVSFLLALFCFFTISISSLYALKSNDLPLLGKVIYLDAGHGGVDSGATYKDIYEKNINLEITKKLEERLGKLGAIVYLTRNGDYDLAYPNTTYRKKSDLQVRANMINQSMCNLYISIHLNSTTSATWKGPQIFYNQNHDDNSALAAIFQETLNKNLNGTREAKEITTLYMQKEITRPGILVEVGFLSNSEERYLLTTEEYQNKVATALEKAVRTYFYSN